MWYGCLSGRYKSTSDIGIKIARELFWPLQRLWNVHLKYHFSEEEWLDRNELYTTSEERSLSFRRVFILSGKPLLKSIDERRDIFIKCPVIFI